MFNNDLMADVHFVVGPPGGTQRLPGHKVSNSCITGLVLRFTKRDPFHEPEMKLGWGGQLADGSQCVFHPSQRRHSLSKGSWPRLIFFFVSLYPALRPTQKHALLTLQSWKVVGTG